MVRLPCPKMQAEILHSSEAKHAAFEPQNTDVPPVDRKYLQGALNKS